jgi:hypothetical protein
MRGVLEIDIFRCLDGRTSSACAYRGSTEASGGIERSGLTPTCPALVDDSTGSRRARPLLSRTDQVQSGCGKGRAAFRSGRLALACPFTGGGHRGNVPLARGQCVEAVADSPSWAAAGGDVWHALSLSARPAHSR